MTKRSIIKDTIGKQHKQSLDDFESLLHILQILLYNLYVLHNCFCFSKLPCVILHRPHELQNYTLTNNSGCFQQCPMNQ